MLQVDSLGRSNQADIVLHAFSGLNRILFPSFTSQNSSIDKNKISLLADKEEYNPGSYFRAL